MAANDGSGAAVARRTGLAGVEDRLAAFFDDRRHRYAVFAALILAGLLVPRVGSNYTLEILTNSFLYIVLCLGLNIIVGYAGLLDLGFAAFFAVGAYSTGILTSTFGWNFWLAIPPALLFTVIVRVIIGAPTLRLRSDYLAIVTLGAGEMIRIIARNMKDLTGGASGLIGIQRPSLFGLELNQISHYYYIFLALAVLAVFASDRLEHSRLGRAWKYVRDDEDAAEAMGIDRVAVKLSAYIIGALFAGLAGCFYAAKMTAISPETFQFMQSIMILVAVVLGGMGKIAGMVVGAMAMVLFPEVFREIGSMRMLVFGLILIVMMIFRPQGIWPDRRH
ncbi:MAG: branched-chain amino acid ABC transporter permease [Desulfobacterales bacterium]|jgi:branched-chain amino acid transport system permease protein|nr:branched-chain amino acid ABC transporter permease [Desulfobacterales bacterium]